MNHDNSTRRLRLERLESRALLTGGVLDFTVDSDLRQPPLSDVDRDLHRPSAESKQTSRHDLSEGRPRGQDPDRGVKRSPDHRSPKDHRPVQLKVDSPAPADSSAPADRYAHSESTNPLTEVATISVPAAQIRPSQIDQNDVVETDSGRDHWQPDCSARAEHFIPSETSNGTIELLPLRQCSPAEARVQAEPWQLNPQTLPGLKRIIANDPLEAAELTDKVLADQARNIWIDRPGGIIELDRVSLPSGVPSIPLHPIDVRLESGLGLHRSLGLVARGMTPALSGPVLDAIMASLEQAAASETQPIASLRSPNVRTFAFPATAVIATTLVISSRRKQLKDQSLSNPQATTAKIR